MFGRLTTKKSRKSGIVRTPYYICNNRKENSICTQPIFSQHHVEHLVLKYIEDLRTRPDLSRIEQRKLAAKKVNVDKLKAKLKRDLEGIKERLKKWQYMFVEELITAEDMRKRLDEESEREKDLLAQLANLQVNEKESTEQQEQLFSIIEYWPALGDMDKKALLNATFDEIKLCTDEVKPKGVKNKYFDASVEIKYR